MQEILAMSLDETNKPLAMSHVLQTANQNLSEAEKQLLRCHFLLGHISFKRIQFLMRSGVLANTEAKRRLHQACCRITTAPKCAACQFGKQTVLPTPGIKQSVLRDKVGITKQGALYPGQRVFVDHFQCSTPGRLFGSLGKTKSSSMYSGGCVFVDACSGSVYVELQVTMSSHETLQSKERYESWCRDHGVVPQECITDNGTAFTS